MNETPRTTGPNPLLEPSPLPYQLPPFDALEPAFFEHGLREAMRRQAREVDAIAANPNPATFANTVVALERSGLVLTRVSRTFSNLVSAHSSPELDALQRLLAPEMARHRDRIMLDAALFERLEALQRQRAQLDLEPEAQALLARYHLDFVRAGARLDASGKARMAEINARLAELSTMFNQNLRNATAGRALTVTDADALHGLSESELAAARAAAAARGENGYRLALVAPTQQPALATLTRRATRERLFRAAWGRGAEADELDNRPLIREIARLRAERARLLGYRHHADYVQSDSMAGSFETVQRFLGELVPRAMANARAEAQALQELIDREGGGFSLAPWDWDFYAARRLAAELDFDDARFKPYLELDSVLRRGVFHAAERLYGITLRPRHDLPVYHPDVMTWEVLEADGRPVGLMLTDFYARPSKKGGAWETEYVSQAALFGAEPVVAIHLNLIKPVAGTPTLLSFEDVTTLFHEFGHALHSLFSMVRYPRFSGTSVPRDFVEFPSQVNEMWASWPDVLRQYARHHGDGSPLPETLVEKMAAYERFNQGYATTEYLAACVLDQAWHQLAPEEIPVDVDAFEREVLVAAGFDPELVPPRYRSTTFAHIFGGGYAAGYYAYLWSEVLDADGARWFRENGGLTRSNGDWLRTTVLAQGGRIDAAELMRRFLGRAPDPSALLERRGLAARA